LLYAVWEVVLHACAIPALPPSFRPFGHSKMPRATGMAFALTARMTSRRLGWVFGLLVPLLVWSSPAAAQCGGTQLCAAGAGDCTIASSCTIIVPDAGLTIDLGARKLVLSKTLTVQGIGLLTINAGSVLVDGGSIIDPGVGGVGGNITINSATSVTFQNDALVDVSGGVTGGTVDLEANNGDLDFSGRIKANGTTRDGDGGAVSLGATGNMTVAGGPIDASGGDRASGGFLDFEVVNGSFLMSAPLNVAGGDGGDVILVGGTTLQTTASADINVSATGDAGSGGSIDLSADGDVSVAGNADGTGAVSADPTFPDGGDGADYCLTSNNGSITVTGQADMSAAAGGSGGQLDFEAGLDLTVSKPMASMATGADGMGGDVTFFTTAGAISLPQPVNVQGGGFGGTMDIEAGTSADVANQLMVDGTISGGQIFLSGCTVTVESKALLSALGPTDGAVGASMNMIQAGSNMTIAGTLKAGAQNLLTYRQPPAPSLAGATIVPAATIQQDPTIPCCVACPVTTTTSSTTSLPTTTTTSSTTTTSAAPPTTTSSTTIVVPTTLPTTTTSSTTVVIPTTTTSSTTSTTARPTTTTTSSSPSTTSTTSSTTTPSTSTTSTTIPTTSSSTTTTPTSTSTTTTVAGDCTQEPLQDFDAVDCRIALLTSAISGESPAEFGGPRKTRALLMHLDNAQNQVDAARQGTKVRAKIRLAIRQLRTLNRALEKTIKNGRTPASVGDFLTARVQEALAELDQLSAAAPNAVVR
jgi:hypothetical protein